MGTEPHTPRLSRRRFLWGTGGLVAGAGAAGVGADFAVRRLTGPAPAPGAPDRGAMEPFYGDHQGGIVTAQQDHTYFAAFDLTTERRSDVADLLHSWTVTASRLCAGLPSATNFPDSVPLSGVATSPASAYQGDTVTVETPMYGVPGTPTGSTGAPDTGEVEGAGPARLTMTLGFGPTLFLADGNDRYGLASLRPGALVEMPAFEGDQLSPSSTGGDLTIQACADDPQVAFHAIRQMARAAVGVAAIKWTQTGFAGTASPQGTPRNLMGFKDGTVNPDTSDGAQMSRFVWAGDEAPVWMRGGAYVVYRRIRMTLESWDDMEVPLQEMVIGRHKSSGAPLGKAHETDILDLGAVDASDNPVIPMSAHVRLASPQSHGGSMILRRGYNYSVGVDQFTEWESPWRSGLEYDAGLLFVCYQRDPRTGFIPIFGELSRNDALNQFTTHMASAICAVPPAAPGPGHWVGEQLFST